MWTEGAAGERGSVCLQHANTWYGSHWQRVYVYDNCN